MLTNINYSENMTDTRTETSLDRYHSILTRVGIAAKKAGRDPSAIKLIAVTKTFEQSDIFPILYTGHRLFGENRVQEAKSKWPLLRDQFLNIDLHLLGPLQSNKVKEAVLLFDTIHSVDRPKIAEAIAAEIIKQKRKMKLFIQVNIGEESQKSGVSPEDTKSFIKFCREDLKLDIEGLMCIPPINQDPGVFFRSLASLAAENSLYGLSMGMSDDFEIAISCGATHIRVGSAIFGARHL